MIKAQKRKDRILIKILTVILKDLWIMEMMNSRKKNKKTLRKILCQKKQNLSKRKKDK